MQGCTYILGDGTRIAITHNPARKKPVIVLQEPDGSYAGHAVFTNEESMAAFIRLFDRILQPKEAGL